MQPFDVLDRIAISVFAGGILGFDVAWILMKIPRIDMAMNTGMLIPAGLAVGFMAGVLVSVLRLKINPWIVSLLVLTLLLPSLYVLGSIFKDIHAGSIVVPILVREGLWVQGADLTVVLILTVLFFVSGLVWSLFSLWRHTSGR